MPRSTRPVRTFLRDDQYTWVRSLARKAIAGRPELREPADALVVRAAVELAMRQGNEDAVVAAILDEVRRAQGAGE